LHVKLFSDQGVKIFPDFVVRDNELVQFPCNPHKENLSGEIDVLVKKRDIAVVRVDEFTDGSDNALVIRAMNQ